MDKIEKLKMRNEQLISEEKIRAKYEGYELPDKVALKKGLKKYNFLKFNILLVVVGFLFMLILAGSMAVQYDKLYTDCYENDDLGFLNDIDFCKCETTAQYQDVVLTSLAVPVYNTNGEVLGYEVDGDYYSKGYSFLK